MRSPRRAVAHLGFLSQIERNKAVPSVTTLYAIAEALGVHVTDFFPDGMNPTKVVRHNARPSFHFAGSAASYSTISTKFPYAGLAAFLMTIKPSDQALPTDESRGTREKSSYTFSTESFVCGLGMASTISIQATDAYFKSSVRHRLENRRNKTCSRSAMITPSIF